jgi:glycosyltransferase involved in cell wall biosynthesis
LLPNYLVSKFRKTKLVYDSHEYFTEIPELISRPFVQNIWKRIESWILPRLKNMYTVNESIALIYKNQYRINPKVIRNIPLLSESIMRSKEELRKELNLPLDKKIFILQGSGINIQRGAEEAVQAISLVENGILLIIGGGDVIPELKMTVQKLHSEDKVIFKNKMPSSELRKYTEASDAGLSLDKDTNLNYRYSLPNKLFDYLHAGIPVIASNLPEVSHVINKYDVGMIINSHQPNDIAQCMNQMIDDKEGYERLKKNTLIAARDLNWQKEQLILLDIFASLE